MENIHLRCGPHNRYGRSMPFYGRGRRAERVTRPGRSAGINRHGVAKEEFALRRASHPRRPRVMWTRLQGRARSVDRSTRRPGIEPRNRVQVPGAEAVSGAEGHTHCTKNGKAQRDLARSYAETPSMRVSTMRENREALSPPHAGPRWEATRRTPSMYGPGSLTAPSYRRSSRTKGGGTGACSYGKPSRARRRKRRIQPRPALTYRIPASTRPIWEKGPASMDLKQSGVAERRPCARCPNTPPSSRPDSNAVSSPTTGA